MNTAIEQIPVERGRLIKEAMNAQVPEDVARYIYGPHTKYAGVPVLKGFSDLSRLALFVNFVRHGIINMGAFQTFRGAGFPAAIAGVARGIHMAFNKAPYAQDIERLKDSGAYTEYTRTAQGAGPVTAALTHIATPGTRMTTNLDLGQRIGMMHYLDENRDTMNLPLWQKGQMINEALFEYNHQSGLAQFSRGIGAQFPHFHLAMIPYAIKAVMGNPRAAAIYSRTIDDTNRELFQGKPYHLDPNIPPETAMRFATDPLSYLRSTYYIPGTLYDLKQMGPLKAAEWLFGETVPFGQQIERPFGLQPYKQYGPTGLNEVLNLGGMSLTKGKP